MYRCVLLFALGFAGTNCPIAHAQSDIAVPVVLDVKVENVRFYLRDAVEPARLASSQDRVDMLQPRNFPDQEGVGDITQINGSATRGTLTLQRSGMILGPDPAVQPGLGIGDTGTRHGGRLVYEFNILDVAGVQIGTIFAIGNNQIGSVPPGAPPRSEALNMAVVGGTGVYLGARGQVTAWVAPEDPTVGSASMVEDPGKRRIHGGGTFRRLIHLIPMTRPEIVIIENAPAVFHSDFTPVTSARPAQRGETVIVMASGLGPTVPMVFGAQPFVAYQQVVSPVQVMIGDTTVDVVNKIGWPGRVGIYRVDFRIPDEVTPGSVPVQLICAWVPGPTSRIPVR